ncbi:hypothetical protein FE391_26445 [Nonomuraea sp. KC401]|uniref:Ig-like domain-containing protein n=1 Tax=unclassified Nonomuraea TaxID=2593643 RepID=UPI0010FEF33D|nr:MULTISPECIES: Ig-like domain-containing protein [unclassified Nonomuraea]NBE99906.1 hypothetical protein [Nonomuraea sp. K271]TLF65059.1 hypothetical protein FE391_26445 [Nonomuraea sp. KC401]
MTVVGKVVAAGAIVVLSVALGGSARAASATWQADTSGQITSPTDGQVLSGSTITVSASTGMIQLSMGLYVEGPSTPSQKVAGGGANQTLSGTFDAGAAPNGPFTVTLKGELTGSVYATSTFKLRRPAETPGNPNVARQGTDKVLVTWPKGAEPDLQSYEVSNTLTGIVGRLPADGACEGTSCRAALTVPAKAEGQRVGFTVKAFRGDGEGGSIGSDPSGAAYLAIPAKTTAKPKKTTKQTPKKRDAKNVDALPTLPAKRQAAPTDEPNRKTTKLPDIPDTDVDGNLPIPTADDDSGGLVPSGARDGTDTAPVTAGDVRAQSSASPLGNIGQYALYVAAGLLLLLLGAHAGAWARRRALAGPGTGATSGATSAPVGAATRAGRASAEGGAHGSHVAQGSQGDVTVPPAAVPLRRRPTVILAVAKTRVPEKSQAEQPKEHQQPSKHERSRDAFGESTAFPTSEPARKEISVQIEVDDVWGVRDTDGARQGPKRIALPSSAVTDVPEGSASISPPAVRIEEHWDDYLPPSPRAMEDSGFWERPQPGSADFWAADDDENERVSAGRRHRGGDS